jgi:hypothetical protein
VQPILDVLDTHADRIGRIASFSSVGHVGGCGAAITFLYNSGVHGNSFGASQPLQVVVGNGLVGAALVADCNLALSPVVVEIHSSSEIKAKVFIGSALGMNFRFISGTNHFLNNLSPSGVACAAKPFVDVCTKEQALLAVEPLG